MGFCDGNVIKYVARHRYKKNPVEDLKKAKWYLERLIQQYEQQENNFENKKSPNKTMNIFNRKEGRGFLKS